MDDGEAAFLRMYFGLDGKGPRTPEEFGEWLGLTSARVDQIEIEALSKVIDLMEREPPRFKWFFRAKKRRSMEEKLAILAKPVA
jgi:DNA-directed RNA polymerase sigma subunit (sigma70/sigma32)